jgi:hypothetical protein
MGIVGRNRKAKPLHLYKALLKGGMWPPNLHPKPTPTETFEQFGIRLKGSDDYVLKALIRLGDGEPNQREYLDRLSELREILHQLDAELHEDWPA